MRLTSWLAGIYKQLSDRSVQRSLGRRRTRTKIATRVAGHVEYLESRKLLSATSIVVSASASTTTSGQTETLIATVSSSGGIPNAGTVTFFDGTTTLGTRDVTNGTATFATTTLPLGLNVVSASYEGAGNFLASKTVLSPSSVLTTIAGKGPQGYSGDTGAATAAELNNPYGIAVDSLGDLFIADTGNNVVREVNATTHAITTVAGNGGTGYSGDGGLATAAEFWAPSYVALDSAGDLFISDTDNNVIREVNATTQIITTVAGSKTYGDYSGDHGLATAATMNRPEGIAVDSAGDLFIADRNNSAIREVNGSTQIITTVAGDGVTGYSGDNGLANAAQLHFPWDVAVDSAGDLFIADTGNARIREVNAVTHYITTIAGNGMFGYSGDNGLATAAELSNIYFMTVDSAADLFIADSGNYVVREVNGTTRIVTTFEGNNNGGNGAGTEADLDGPGGLATDSAGDLLIVDTGNSNVPNISLIREAVTGVAITVNPLTSTSTRITAASVAYNGQAYSATAAVTASGNAVTSPAVTYSYYLASDTTFSNSISAPTHVGNYVVVASYAGNQTYSPSQAQASFSITQANITFTIGNDQQTYGTAENLALDLGTTTSTGVNGENLAINYSSTGDSNNSHVNSYAITGVLANGTGVLSDYSVTLNSGTLTVIKDPITLTIANDSQPYGTAANLATDLGTTISTGANGQNLSISYSSTGDTNTAHVNTYGITGVLSNGTGLLSDYNITLNSGTLTVNKDSITLTIANDSQPYGTAANLVTDLGTTIDTGVNGQNLSISYSSTGDTNTTHVNTYGITGVLSNGTGLLSDYNVTLNNGTLTVVKDSITLTIANDSQPYGAAADLANDLGATLNTGVNAQNLGIVYSSTGDTSTAAVGTYAITGVLSNGTGLLSDYNVTLNNGTLTVAQVSIPPLPGGVSVEKSLVSSDGVAYDLDSLGNLYSWVSPAATWTPLDSGVTNIALAGNGDVVDLHGDGGLYEFADHSSASSGIKLDAGVASFAIVGNGDVVDLHLDGGVYEFTAYRSASSFMKLDNNVQTFAIAGNGDVIELSNAGVYEFTAFRNASSIMKLDNSVQTFAIAGNGDVIELSNAGVYEFTAYRNASSIMKLDNSVTSFAIAGNGDVIELSNAGVYEFTAFRSAVSILKLDNSVTNFAIAGNGDVIELSNAGLYEFTADRNAGSIMKLDNSVTGFAIAGNGDVIDLSNAGLYEFTAYRDASSIMKLDNSVTSFAIAGNGDVIDLSAGGLYEFTAYRSVSSEMKIDTSVTGFAIAGNGDVVDLHGDGGLYEFTAFRSTSSKVTIGSGVTSFAIAANGDVEYLLSNGELFQYSPNNPGVLIDEDVTNLQIASNGLVEDQHTSGDIYIQTIFGGPVAQSITQFM